MRWASRLSVTRYRLGDRVDLRPSRKSLVLPKSLVDPSQGTERVDRVFLVYFLWSVCGVVSKGLP